MCFLLSVIFLAKKGVAARNTEAFFQQRTNISSAECSFATMQLVLKGGT